MYGLTYSCTVSQVVVSAIQDLFELTAPADSAVVLLGCEIGQETDYGDAEAEGLPVQIVRYASSGSGGTAGVEVPLQVGFPAAGSAVEINNTTQGGTPTVLYGSAFNVQAGWLYKPVPEERILVSPSGIIAVELPVAPTDALTVTATLTWMELGG